MCVRTKVGLRVYLEEGMDEMEFSEAQANLRDIIQEYDEMGGIRRTVDEEQKRKAGHTSKGWRRWNEYWIARTARQKARAEAKARGE